MIEEDVLLIVLFVCMMKTVIMIFVYILVIPGLPVGVKTEFARYHAPHKFQKAKYLISSKFKK
jgi:hypothetical protein